MPAAQKIDPELLRQVLRRFAAGATIITSVNQAGGPAGMTATAFSSVSLTPPMVLVCVDANARTRRAIEGHAAFAVNLLASDQEHVARRFATRIDDKFEGIGWHPGENGVPLLDGTLASLECRVHQSLEAGTHIIYIGDVLAGSIGARDPLVYFEGDYRTLRDPSA